MTIFKYQGSVLTGGNPGDLVSLNGFVWTVTEQGHLESEDIEVSKEPIAVTLISSGYISEQVEE